MSELNLPGDIPAPLQALLGAVPDFSVGERVRQLYVNHLTGMIPGHASQWLGHERTFREVFFPSWQALPGHEQVMLTTGLSSAWWNDFAAAVLCQAMTHLTTILRPQMLRTTIAQAVQAQNYELQQRSAPFYAWVLAQALAPLRDLAGADRAAAKDQYRQALIAHAKVLDQATRNAEAYPEGWGWFHHYAKLLALGATPGEVDEVIDAVRGMGVVLPASVETAVWQGYSAYLKPRPSIDYQDMVEAAHNGVLTTTALPSYGGVSFSMLEGYAFEFTARGQPGNIYYRAPNSGSCFSGNTLVLLANGQAKPIRSLRPGQMVATPAGPQRVGFISTPLLHRRALHQINDLGFGFTDSHPFVQLAGGNAQPGLLCVNPEALLANIPSSAQVGVGTLQAGATLWGLPGATHPTHPSELAVTSVSTFPSPESDPHVYDLVLLGSAGQAPQFYVGNGQQFLLTTTEMPLLADFPHATVAILTALIHATPALANLAQGAQVVLTAPDAADKLFARLHFLSVTQLSQWLARLAPQLDPAMLLHAPSKTPSLRSQMEEYLMALDDLDPAQNVAFGAFFEKLTARLAEELELAVHLGWRSFPTMPGDVVALSLDTLRLQVGHGLPPSARVRLEVKTLGLPQEETFTCWSGGSRPHSGLVQHFDQVLYLQTPYHKGGLHGLTFAWYAEGGEAPLGTAISYWPDHLQTPYRRFAPPVYMANGPEVGEFQYDVRLLTHDQVTAEKGRMTPWQTATAAKEHYAHQLGLRLGALLNEFAKLPFER